MRVIITGGTGLIGRALAAELAAAGHTVVLLSRAARQDAGLPPAVSIHRWDGRSAAGWQHLIDGDTAIVNLAGENLSAGRWTPDRKATLVSSRLRAGEAVMEAVQGAAGKPGVVIQSSAVGYYGPLQDQVVNEGSPPGSDFLARLAVDWEASTAGVEAVGIRRAVIRTGVVLSPAGGALPRMILPYRFFAGGPLGSGRQWMSWIHIRDEARAIAFLLENNQATGAYNLTAPGPVTNANFSRAIGRAMHRPALLPVPALALRLLFGEMATVLLTGQNVAPERLKALGFRFLYPELDGALRQLLRREL